MKTSIEVTDGERWIEVVKIAAANNRLIVLPQAAFGELSESSRDCDLQARAWSIRS